jgi:hypothetical protein
MGFYVSLGGLTLLVLPGGFGTTILTLVARSTAQHRVVRILWTALLGASAVLILAAVLV